MKVTPNTKQCLEGSISATELAAFLRQTLEIPEGARITFTFRVPGGGDYSNMDLEVTDAEPLQFTAEWSGNKSAEQTVPARAVVAVKPA
jgi:phenylalanyl-tRNA synthetase beta subunit